MKEFYKNQRILVTGATGTVGREIVRLLHECEPEELRLMDNNESEVFFLAESVLGFNPTIRLEEGIKGVYEWFTSLKYERIKSATVLSGSE